MKKLYSFIISFFASIITLFSAQTYQLTGNPVNITGWSLIPTASINADFVQLTPDQTDKVGGIKLNDPINLKFCDKWKVEFDFKIDGNGTTQFGKGDGLTFWYLANPPATFPSGGGLGIPPNSTGLIVAFDIFNNTNEAQMSKVHILYGTHASGANIEYNNTPGSSYHSNDLYSTLPFQNGTVRHVEVNGQIDPANPANWIITVKIDGTQIVNQSFVPAGAAAAMAQGYFGFSSATGGASARHQIKNVKIFVDKVPILQPTVSPTSTCPNAVTGIVSVDLTSYNNQFVTNPGNYQFTYVVNGTTTPIANPTNFQFSTPTTVNVIVQDPTGTLCDNPDGKIILTPQTVQKDDVTLKGCPMNGTATFNLTTAAVTAVTPVTKRYYPTINDLNNGTSEITNPQAYQAVNGALVYVKITTSTGCVGIAKITLEFNPVPTVTDGTIESCGNTDDPSFGTFNLTTINVTTTGGTTKKYFANYNDAIAGINEIPTPAAYISESGFAYIKVINSSGCGAISKITLKVIPQKFSDILKDKTICIEARTTLDAGPGFTSYKWSTGETTQSISGVTVGQYWVELKTGNCTVTQKVTVWAAKNPVIKSVKIDFKKATIEVEGGNAPYFYSIDGIYWQTSNVFENLTRADYTFYVKDAYNCQPVSVNVTIPNLINVITNNGDGSNDRIDLSALRYKNKLQFDIFDRYGNKVFNGDYKSNYIWDGTIFGRKVPTGTYWYSISWEENDKVKTPVLYNGWILVKNRN